MSCPALVPNHRAVQGPVVVVVMDGVGIGKGDEADAVRRAHTPNLDAFAKQGLSTVLQAHGTSVGMPSDADMGNSEVGHNAIGAGRIFAQGAKLVTQAIESGALFHGPGWMQMVSHLKRTQGTVHLLGLLSDGNVHSHIAHLEALLQRCHHENLKRARIHILLDGRDVPKTSALDYVARLEGCIENLRQAGADYAIASGGGRMVTTMDRYASDWSIVERGWQAHVLGKARSFASAREAIETFRVEIPGITDQELPPFVIAEKGEPLGPIVDGDAVVAFNFRGDRMLQLCAAFEEEHFTHFDRERFPQVHFAGMTLYDGDTQTPKNYLVLPPEITCPLGELLCDASVAQLACAETQKFGHVTYFWNGNRSGCFNEGLEKYVEVPSRAPPFDAHPEMRAPEITDVLLKELASTRYRFARVNYANGDMVGHTGNFKATVRAVETVDTQLGRLSEMVLATRGALLVTADHGNADDMAERDKLGTILRDSSGAMIAKTSHSLNPVPFHLILHAEDKAGFCLASVERPGLGNVAATAALLLGFEQPEDFLPSLIAHSH